MLFCLILNMVKVILFCILLNIDVRLVLMLIFVDLDLLGLNGFLVKFDFVSWWKFLL